MRTSKAARGGGVLAAVLFLPCGGLMAQEEAPKAELVPPPEGIPRAEVVAGDPDRAEAKPMTVSASGQFVIHGANLTVRNAVASLAEKTRKALVEEVGGGEKWTNTIVIELRGKPGDEVPPRLFAPQYFTLPNGFRLQLFVHLARGVDRDALERHLLELLVYERALRGRDPAGFREELQLPRWLTEGLRESFRWRRQEGDRALYAAMVERKALFPVERLLADEKTKLGAGERDAFRASAGALVMALLGQEGGKEGMAAYLAEAGTFRGEQLALLMKHFPGMNLGEKSLEKWWALQLAKLAESTVPESLTILATEAELEALLVVRFDDGRGATIELRPAQFRDLLALEAQRRGEVVKPMADRLSLLHYRAFPAYRPIITAYLKLVAELLEDRDAQFDEQLAELESGRAFLVSTGERTRDLLDWYRITTAREMSGAFEDYARLVEELDRKNDRRTGPVSRYLDDLQKVYDR